MCIFSAEKWKAEKTQFLGAKNEKENENKIRSTSSLLMLTAPENCMHAAD